VFCRLLFVLFLLAMILSVIHQLADSDYRFGVFKLVFRAFYIHISVVFALAIHM
jgi:hypothetical protein